jgi:hypothetical protein
LGVPAGFWASELTYPYYEFIEVGYQVNLSNGKGLIEGKTMARFANAEEDFANNYVEKKVMPFRIENEAKKLGNNFITGGYLKNSP